MGYIKKRRAQSTLEYAIVIFVVIAALLALSNFFKRAVQGKGRQASEQIGDQFSPQTTEWDYTTESYSETRETTGIEGKGVTKSELQGQGQYQRKYGEERVGSLDEEYYPQ